MFQKFNKSRAKDRFKQQPQKDEESRDETKKKVFVIYKNH